MVRTLVADNNLSPVVQILTLLLLVVGVLAVVARTIVKLVSIRKLSSDDYLIFASLIFYAAQSVAVYIETENGLGQPSSTLRASQLSSQSKAGYSAIALQIASLTCAKLSFLTFCRVLTPVPFERRITTALTVLVCAWFLASELTALFQCKLPEPWQYFGDSCFDRAAWWEFVAIVNILTEALLLALPLKIVLGLQTSRARKIPAMLVFASRILIIVAVALQLNFFLSALKSPDISLALWAPVVCSQFVQCISIVTTSMLYIKQLIDSLETGFLRVDDTRRRQGEYGSSQGKSSKTSKRSGRSTDKKPASESRAWAGRGSGRGGDQDPTEARSSSNIDLPEWDQTSNTRMIVETRSWTVESQR